MTKLDEMAEMINFLAGQAREAEAACDFRTADYYHTAVANAAEEFARESTRAQFEGMETIKGDDFAVFSNFQF